MLHRLVNVLDGKPRGGRGQSLVEMTLTFPILILMVLSLVEIGFVANNYLVLMDLVREAGRRGANLNPVAWDESNTRSFERLDCDTDTGRFNLAENHPQNRNVPRGKGVLDQPPLNYGDPLHYSTVDGPFGFFDGVVCQAILSFAPLNFESPAYWGADGTTPPPDANYYTKNDIVVSAVAYARLDYSNPANILPGGGTIDPGGKLPPDKTWITVTGRYPLSNRYCHGASGTGDARDPFDFKRSEFYSLWQNGWPPDPGEMGALDPKTGDYTGHQNEIDGLYDATASQGIRGFVFTGASMNPADGCIGSRFTVQDIEQRLNTQAGTYDSSKFTPNGGMVIVEMFWQHHPLFLGPLFQGFTGNPVDDPVLYLYGIFPTTAAEPTATPAS
jgi:hypothetical protein